VGCLGFESRKGRDISLLQNVQKGYGVHPASSPVVTGVLSPGIKRPGREINDSSPSNAEVKNQSLYFYSPNAFMTWIGKTAFTRLMPIK
jgi:hypothetical protein